MRFVWINFLRSASHKMCLRWIWIWMVSITWTSVINAQIRPKDSINVIYKDSFQYNFEQKPSYFRAASDVTAVNLIVNRLHVYVTGFKWAEVTPSSWWLNIHRGFYTDGDAFSTNWIAHPIHGSLYHNAARSNSVDLWKTFPYVLGGSLMWEYFGETEPPSEIDIMTTTFGGMYLGEVIYRLSDYTWNHPRNQGHPWFQAITTGVINPIGSINRYAFRKKIPVSAQSLTPVSMDLFLGFNYPFQYIIPGINPTGLYLNADLYYGNLFDKNVKTFGPFDYFKVNSWLTFSQNAESKNIPYYNMSSEAIIYGKKIKNIPNKVELVSLSQHYDFIHNDMFKLGTIVLTGDWTYMRQFENVLLTSSTKVGIILFGSGNSESVKPIHEELFEKFNRDYIYGQGLMAEAEVKAIFKNIGILAANASHFRIYSRVNPTGIENIELLRGRYLYPLNKRTNIGLQYDRYHRNSAYYTSLGFQRRSNYHSELRIIIGYTLQ